MTKKTIAYIKGLKQDLADPEEAAAYLNAALEDGDQDVFLLALRDVADAHGFSKLAKESKLHRVSLYRTLSATGNPRLSSLTAVLDGVGLRLVVEPT